MSKVEFPTSPLVPKLAGLHLFHFDGAPCAQRVRFALGEKGLSRGREVRFMANDEEACLGEEGKWVSRVVSLVKKDHMKEDYAKIHPNMVVPALVHDGALYLESMDIIEYLDQVFGGNPLVPINPNTREHALGLTEQAKVLHLSIRYVTFYWGLGRLAMLNGKEQTALRSIAAAGNDGENLVQFYEGFSNKSIPLDIYEGHLGKLYTAFQQQEHALQDGRNFLCGETLTIADVFWAMKVLRLLECGYPIKKHHPAFYEWYQRMYQRPAFQNEVMGKNRIANRVFRIKSGVENLFGAGLNKAVARLAK